MKRKPCAIKQIVAALKQAEWDMPVTDRFRADLLQIETPLRGPGVEPGPQPEATTKSERVAKEVNRQIQPGQGDAARDHPENQDSSNIRASSRHWHFHQVHKL